MDMTIHGTYTVRKHVRQGALVTSFDLRTGIETWEEAVSVASNQSGEVSIWFNHVSGHSAPVYRATHWYEPSDA